MVSFINVVNIGHQYPPYQQYVPWYRPIL